MELIHQTIRPQYRLALPLDWGIAFAAERWLKLMLLIPLPLCAELLGIYFLYFERLTLEKKVLVYIMSAMGNAWLICAVVSYVIFLARGEAIKLRDLFWHALVNLPKVFISYCVTVVCVFAGLAVFVFPGVLLFSLFLWAPAFCAAESCVPLETKQPRKARRLDEDDDEEVAIIEDQDEQFFLNMPSWSIGLKRSVILSNKSFFTAVQFVLLLVAAGVLPSALVDLVFREGAEFLPQVVKVIASMTVGVFIMASWAATFVYILPPEAKEELEIKTVPDFPAMLPHRIRRLLAYEGKLRPQLILLALITIGGWFEYSKLLTGEAMPNHVQREIISVQSENDDIVATILLTDRKTLFHWFEPSQLKLGLKNAERGQSVTEQKNEGTLVQPSRVYIFDAETEELLSEDNFAPSRVPLRLLAHFPKPQPNIDLSQVQVFYGSNGELRALNN